MSREKFPMPSPLTMLRFHTNRVSAPHDTYGQHAKTLPAYVSTLTSIETSFHHHGGSPEYYHYDDDHEGAREAWIIRPLFSLSKHPAQMYTRNRIYYALRRQSQVTSFMKALEYDIWCLTKVISKCSLIDGDLGRRNDGSQESVTGSIVGEYCKCVTIFWPSV